MNSVKMHADEVDTDVALVRRLLAGQFPQWANMAIKQVPSYGTDHAIYQVGSDLSVRLPRIAYATRQAEKEARWLPVFAPLLPLEVPVQLAAGRPAEGYPFAWSVYQWLDGQDANGTIDDLVQAAVDLGEFVNALHRIDTADAPPHSPSGRGGPLAEQDEDVREAIAQLGGRIDGQAALASWEESLSAPEFSGAHVWVHGDLLPGNVLVRNGRLAAIIDFGTLQVGDPAGDLQPAWNMFAGESRQRFRTEVGADDACWLRGRGTVLYQTVMALAYYWDTNPGMVRQASHGLAQVLADR